MHARREAFDDVLDRVSYSRDDRDIHLGRRLLSVQAEYDNCGQNDACRDLQDTLSLNPEAPLTSESDGPCTDAARVP